MFKQLLEFSLKNRLLVVMFGLAISVYGVMTIARTPVDVFPDLNKPTVTIMTESGVWLPRKSSYSSPFR